jgi:hypothetical protein
VPCEHPGCDHKYQSHYDDEYDENPCIAETPFGRRLRVSTPPDGLGSLDCAQRRIANLVINAEGNRTEIEIWHETKLLDDWPGYTTPERWRDAGVPETRSRSCLCGASVGTLPVPGLAPCHFPAMIAGWESINTGTLGPLPKPKIRAIRILMTCQGCGKITVLLAEAKVSKHLSEHGRFGRVGAKLVYSFGME